MSNKRSNEQMNDLRDRLYARGSEKKRPPRTTLPEKKLDVPNTWQKTPPTPPTPPVPPKENPVINSEEPAPNKKSRKYRGILVLVGLVFFVLSVVLSSVYILLGQNTISGNNIDISLSAPFTISGGDIVSLQIGLTNYNSVPVESATLVVEYPEGTRKVDEENTELRTERIPLSEIAAGETFNVPLRARIFGEENQEYEIKASIEYRVSGSNATFYKESEPHRIKIGTAPVVMSIDAEEKISSGEETEIALTIRNNSADSIKNLLVKADYPNGFDFSGSDPEPSAGRDVWNIEELEAESETTITIRGIVLGTESEQRSIKFAAGLGSERDQANLSSIIAVADTEFTLEEPFLNVEVSVNNSDEDTISVEPGEQVSVSIDIQNNLDSSVYDTGIEVILSGNALEYTRVRPVDGYYDSSSRTIRWESSSNRRLSKLDPEESTRLSFSLSPDTEGLRTPQLQFFVKATGRRVSDSNAREEISGDLNRTIKIESKPDLSSEIIRTNNDSGPVPPEVGEETTYTIVWEAESATNDISGTTVSATLPNYVTWTGVTSGDGSWSYNPTSRIVEWTAGDIEAGEKMKGDFRVSFLPSSQQIGRTPELVGNASLRATDSFTGSILRTSAPSQDTELYGDNGSGEVQSN